MTIATQRGKHQANSSRPNIGNCIGKGACMYVKSLPWPLMPDLLQSTACFWYVRDFHVLHVSKVNCSKISLERDLLTSGRTMEVRCLAWYFLRVWKIKFGKIGTDFSPISHSNFQFRSGTFVTLQRTAWGFVGLSGPLRNALYDWSRIFRKILGLINFNCHYLYLLE